MNSRDHIYKLIAQGEHQQLDFKFEMNDSRKIARTLCAFANTDGGKLLVGVKDNGKIIGVDTEEEMYMVEAAAQVFSTPEVKIEGILHEVEGKEILEVTVERSVEKHFVKELEGRPIAYIRKDDMNLKASLVHLRMWEMQRNRKDQRFNYGPKEELLFSYLKEHEYITFKRFSKISKQHYLKATDTLARLVLWGVLNMVVDEKEIRFEFAEDHELRLKSLNRKMAEQSKVERSAEQ